MSTSSNPLKLGKGLSVFAFMLIIYITCFFLQSIIPILRYAKYLLPFIAAIDFISFRNNQKFNTSLLRKYFFPHLYLYSFIIFCSFIFCIIQGSFKEDTVFLRFFQETYFLFAPLIFVSIIYFAYIPSRKNYYIKYVLWGFAITCFPEVIQNLLGQPTESDSAFPLGLIFLYFVFSGKVFYSIISLLLTIVGSKRITFLGIAVSLVLYFLLKKTRFPVYRYKNSISLLLVIVNFIVVNVIIQFTQGGYDELIFRYTGLSADAFTMGRQQLYEYVLKSLDNYSWLGAGLGKTASLAGELDSVDIYRSGGQFANLHSDVLKHFLEFGSVLFSFWIFLVYRFNTKSVEMFTATIYINVLWMTDNVIIYFDLMFIYYLLQGFLMSNIFTDYHKTR